MTTCYQCGRRTKSPRYGILGQPMCASCENKQTGLVVGGMTGGAGGAVAGPGILSWVRRSLRRRPDRS